MMVVVKAQDAKNQGEKDSGINLAEEIDWRHYAQLLRKELHSRDLNAKAQTMKRKKSEKPPSAKQVQSRKEFKQKVAQAVEMHAKSKADFEKGLGPKKQWKECMAEVYAKKEEV
jgi:hypothetical protein